MSFLFVSNTKDKRKSRRKRTKVVEKNTKVINHFSNKMNNQQQNSFDSNNNNNNYNNNSKGSKYPIRSDTSIKEMDMPLPSSSTNIVEKPVLPVRSCPININNCPSGRREFHKALKNKLEASGIMTFCPVMGKSLPGESKDFAITAISSTPTDSIRPDTPEEEKLDLKHLSVSLMKLLYPKVSQMNE